MGFSAQRQRRGCDCDRKAGQGRGPSPRTGSWGRRGRCLSVTPSRGSGDGTAPSHGAAGGSSCIWVEGARARGGHPREGCGTHKGPGLPARPSRAPTTSWRHSLSRTLHPAHGPAFLQLCEGGWRAVGLGTRCPCAGEGSEGGPRVLLMGHLSKALRSHRSPITGGETEAQRGR